MSRYDIVLYGASGFTGQYVIEYLHRAAVDQSLSWAVAGTVYSTIVTLGHWGQFTLTSTCCAGRDEGRLKAALARAGAVVEADLSRVPTIICDSSVTSSLLAMASQAKVVLNCVGPYRFYGEPVVEACVEAGSHHVDISGEPQYLEKMQLKYHQVRNIDNMDEVCCCKEMPWAIVANTRSCTCIHDRSTDRPPK